MASSDDLYPNDSTFFGLNEPKDQVNARRKTRAQTLEALPVLRALLARLQERVDFYGSVDAMPPEIKADPEKFLIMHNANEMTRDSLKSEMLYIQELISNYGR